MPKDLEQAITTVEFNAALQRLDELVQAFERHPFPQVQADALEMLQAIDVVHREALGRLIAFIHAQGQAELVLRAAHDPAVRTLLELYDFLPDAEGLPGPAPPPFSRPAGLIPLDTLDLVPRRQTRQPVLQKIARTEEIPPGTFQAFQIETLPVLVANVKGEFFAVRDCCPGSVAPLHLGHFTAPVITCPWHNEAWDIRTGKRTDGDKGLNLEILPVRASDGLILLAVTTTPTIGKPHLA